jgi:hypothetical protein
MEFKNDLDTSFIAQPLPVASRSVEYQAYKILLHKIDQIIVQSGTEADLQKQAGVTSELHNNLDSLLAAVDTEVWVH